MNPDPRFPDRPTHEDFALLSEIVIKNDEVASAGGLNARVSEFVDLGSLTYMAEQRARMAVQAMGFAQGEVVDALVLAMASAIIDGFTMGAAFATVRSEPGSRIDLGDLTDNIEAGLQDPDWRNH